MNCFKITIADRFRPFSHEPGIVFPVPNSHYAVEIYPSRLHFYSLLNQEKFSHDLDAKGSIENFTALCDLERGGITVSFKSQGIFQRVHIFYDEQMHVLKEAPGLTLPLRKPKERFSLGNAKMPQVERLRARRDLEEILPLWFMMGQAMPETAPVTELESLNQILSLFQASTKGLLVPDMHRHLLFGEGAPSLGSPLQLLHGVYRSIRSWFFQEKEGIQFILPRSLQGLDAGRMTGLQFSLGTIDIEWSKHQLRRVVVHAEKNGVLDLILPKNVQSFRLRPSLSEKASRQLDITAGSDYFFDNFICT